MFAAPPSRPTKPLVGLSTEADCPRSRAGRDTLCWDHPAASAVTSKRTGGARFGQFSLVVTVMLTFATISYADERQAQPAREAVPVTPAADHQTPGPAVAAEAGEPVNFNRDIRPILSQACFPCHGPDAEARRGGLRLDTAEGAREDLGGYPAIVPGDASSSEVWRRLTSEDPDLKMPPPESHLTLTSRQERRIRRWIDQGGRYADHWAFQTPSPPIVPPVAVQARRGKPWGNNAVDAFVADAMGRAGLRPSPEAPPRMLIRRLFLDLTGLPPSVDQVRSFVEDYRTRGESAWQDRITRLLDSPHFGERMAIPWLDQARYADTNGYSIDGGREMWLWRDWVIHAYNENLPFDEFLQHQIAGDLMPGATDAHRTATGFNRNHMVTHEGGTIDAENLTNYAADRVKTTSEVFLGLTMGCAQCHDHKYDPITQREYYRFFAFFNELSDRGRDGNGGRNPVPSILTRTVLPDDELPALRAELKAHRERLLRSKDGFDHWLDVVRRREATRGERFESFRLSPRDVSSPNRPGDFTIRDDGSVEFDRPGRGLNAISHSFALPAELSRGRSIDGIRIRFFPRGEGDRRHLSPHKGVHAPRVTTVLVSAGKLPAKQVEIHRQRAFSQATASSAVDDRSPEHVMDETNVGFWQPRQSDREQHLTLTFDRPIDPDETPFLSVMVFFGVPNSLPYHWAIEAFSGSDTDSRYPHDVSRLVRQKPSAWTPQQRERVAEVFRRESPSLERLRVRIKNLEERIDVFTKPHSTMVMDVAPSPRPTFVLSRGQYDAPGEKVAPGTPSVLPKLGSQQSPKGAVTGGADRLDLARWMTDPRHPLTARVAVNRLWSVFFGVGIVPTSADFGSQGTWPSHPKLLDHLACQFVRDGWDQKRLIRRMVTSATYRQDSRASDEALAGDPNNRWLARGPRFRLSAEMVRDHALAVSGLLVRRIGGPSVQPYQPPGLWKEVSHFGSTPATKQVYVQDHGEKLYRRSLYTITKRTSPHPAMSAFDAPNREMCTVQRGVTNTPLQALVMLNDTQFVEAARVFAANLLRDTTLHDDAARVRRAFEQTTSRLPTPAETELVLAFLERERKRFADTPDSAVRAVRAGEWPIAGDLDSFSHAAWTQVAAMMFNLSESLTRQ